MTDREKITPTVNIGNALRLASPEQRRRIEAITAQWPVRTGNRDEYNRALRQTIADLAIAWNGEWLNPDTDHFGKLWLRCERGHVWQGASHRLRWGRWCPACFSSVPSNTIEMMQGLAEARGGKCLSTEYQSSKKNLLWQCAKGHQWWADAEHVKAGTWCSLCNYEGRRFDLPMMQALAESKGGRCLSEQYLNVNKPMLWQCGEGHVWRTAAAVILTQGSWCRRCFVERRRGKIEKMQAIAVERGGKCLSTQYVHSQSKLQWQCKLGHVWWSIPNRIQRGCWCPQCAILNSCKTEKKRRKYLANWRHGGEEG
jgi:hypothetical protein